MAQPTGFVGASANRSKVVTPQSLIGVNVAMTIRSQTHKTREVSIMSIHEFQSRIRKNESNDLIRALRELTCLETDIVMDLGIGPWT